MTEISKGILYANDFEKGNSILIECKDYFFKIESPTDLKKWGHYKDNYTRLLSIDLEREALLYSTPNRLEFFKTGEAAAKIETILQATKGLIVCLLDTTAFVIDSRQIDSITRTMRLSVKLHDNKAIYPSIKAALALRQQIKEIAFKRLEIGVLPFLPPVKNHCFRVETNAQVLEFLIQAGESGELYVTQIDEQKKTKQYHFKTGKEQKPVIESRLYQK